MLEAGYDVICDRYYYSSIAYQGSETDFEWVKTLNISCPEISRPDVCIFLDLDPERAFMRKGGRDQSDRMENEKLSFHKEVYRGYKAIAESQPDRVITIDASVSAEEVFANVISELKKRNII